MSAYAFLVRGRSVDLVSMSAAHALRVDLGVGDELVALHRDEVHLLEGIEGGDPGAWTDACTRHANWFNPNKHRFALCEAAEGGIEAARTGGPWPTPWLHRRVHTDRPDILAHSGGADALHEWLGLTPDDDAVAVTLAVWDRDEVDGRLPAGHWPEPSVATLPLVLWTLVLRSGDAAHAAARAEELAITRHRRQGLLVHPHMEGWARVAPAVSREVEHG